MISRGGDDFTLFVSAESDEIHYADRPPGPMLNARGEFY